MANVRFTKHLTRFFPGLANQASIEVPGQTVAGVVAALDKNYPGLAAYIVDEQGALRKHVNIFVDGELIHDREKLLDSVTADDRIYIFQALSGGQTNSQPDFVDQ